MSELLKSLITQGGVFVLPLLLASVVVVAIAIERVVYFLGLEPGGDVFRDRLRGFIRGGDLAGAATWLKSLRGPVPVTALAAIETWDQGQEAAEAAMATRARLEGPKLRKFLGFLDTTYSGAPLIGLLGTIVGMMSTFRVVAQHLAKDPNADTSSVTAGIGEALITTATGIAVAVLCLVFHNIFQSWADARMDAAEVVAADVVESLAEARPHRAEKAAR